MASLNEKKQMIVDNLILKTNLGHMHWLSDFNDNFHAYIGIGDSKAEIVCSKEGCHMIMTTPEPRKIQLSVQPTLFFVAAKSAENKILDKIIDDVMSLGNHNRLMMSLVSDHQPGNLRIKKSKIKRP